MNSIANNRNYYVIYVKNEMKKLSKITKETNFKTKFSTYGNYSII